MSDVIMFVVSSSLPAEALCLEGRAAEEHSLYVVDVLPVFPPLVREVRGVGVGLALQECILGHVEGGVLWGDEDDGRTWFYTQKERIVGNTENCG